MAGTFDLQCTSTVYTRIKNTTSTARFYITSQQIPGGDLNETTQVWRWRFKIRKLVTYVTVKVQLSLSRHEGIEAE